MMKKIINCFPRIVTLGMIMMNENNAKINKKIVLLGLDNAGKTSILKTVKNQMSPESTKNLKPTKGLNIEEMEINNEKIVVWDLGGQISFRQEYIKRQDYYFSYVDSIIYVIDIQDPDRYEESFKYLLEIISVIKLQKLVPKFLVFLHKSDPDYQKSKTYEELYQDLSEKIKKIFHPLRFSAEIFKTSIYSEVELNQILKRI
ncbi:MAG: GTP-binding protein [Candidatus Helarchaeota archaeon]|nr:GTP-binding protein [Candidatus Helarchaeota archaeon]